MVKKAMEKRIRAEKALVKFTKQMLKVENIVVKINWLEIVEKLNKQGNNVWTKLIIRSEICGVRKIRPYNFFEA